MSRELLNQTFRQYFPVIRERCRRLLGDGEEASDVAQETFIRFWQVSESARAPRHAAAWIHRTSVHLAIDLLRTRVNQVEVSDALRAPTLDTGAILESRQNLALLAKRVDAQALEAGVLTRVDGLSQLEVAQLLGCSERTVRRLLTSLDEALVGFRQERWS